MKKKIIILFVVVGLLVLASGCVEETTDEKEQEQQTPTEKATTSIYIGDDYADDFDFVNVTFSEIKLHNITDNESETWISFISDPLTIDLKDLHDRNVTSLISTLEIPLGNYTKLWINVTNATGVLNETGENITFSVPSGWLKIQQLHFNISKGNNNITVYINLNKSIRYVKGLNEYKLTPVISKIQHEHNKELKFQVHDQSKIRNMANSPPTIVFLLNDSAVSKNIYLDADTNYTFNASGSFDVDEDEITFLWDFGDGTTSNESEIIHSYEDSNSTYKLTLTVNDGEDESVESFNVHINKTSGNGQG